MVSSRKRSSQSDEMKNREACSVRMQKNVVSARSQGRPRLNDIAVNDDTLGVTIQPCTIYKDTQKDDNQLVTWKLISNNKKESLRYDGSRCGSSIISRYPPQEFHQFHRENISQLESINRTEDDRLMASTDFMERRIEKNSLTEKSTQVNVNKINKADEDVRWLEDGIENLNRIYLIKDSEDIEQPEIFHDKWKPIRHSPRVEFYLKDARENETKPEKGTLINNEEIGIAECEEEGFEINNEDTKADGTEMDALEELMMDKEVEEDDKRASDEEIGTAERKAERLNVTSENEKTDCETQSKHIEFTEYDAKKLEMGTEDQRDSQIVADESTERPKHLIAIESDETDHLIIKEAPTDKEIPDYIVEKEIKRTSSDPNRYVEISSCNIRRAAEDPSRECKDSSSKELNPNSSVDDAHFISDENFETLATYSSTVVADDCTNAIFSQAEVNRQENFFDNSNKFDDNVRDEKTDFNEDSYNGSNNKIKKLSDRSIVREKVTLDTDLLVRNIDIDSDYGDDDVCAEEYNTEEGADDSQSSLTLKNALRRRITPPRRVLDLATRPTPREQRQVNPAEWKQKMRKSMNILQGSTDSLISSVELVELASLKRPETNFQRETIEIIGSSRRSRVFQNFPDIRGELAEARENSERSYWEKATRITRDKLIGLDPSCHERYKFTKRNPRVRVLPPVRNPSVIIHR